MMRNGTTTKRVAAIATALGLTALAAPVLLSPASAAGARIGSRAIVDSPRGPVLLARVSGQASSLKVTFACKGGAAVFTRTLRGTSSDTAAARITGANAQRVTGCSARAGASQRSIAALPAGQRAAGAHLVGILGPALPLAGGSTRLDVAISAPGAITVKTTAGRTLLKTGRHLAGVYRLLVRNAPRGTGLVVTAIGASDRILAGSSPSAAPPPAGQETVTPPDADGTTPGAPGGGTPAPTAPVPQRPAPPAVPISHLTLACPGNVPIGGTLTVTGQITPATEGLTIIVSFSIPGRPGVSDTVLTGPGGVYTAQTSETTTLGTWNIQSYFPGTATLQTSSQSASASR